jgi:uncharacterized protein (DUF1330 family)
MNSPSKDAARRWYDSAAFQEVRQYRTKGAKYLVILTEGGVPPKHNPGNPREQEDD